jgi:hypothetical protein
MCAVSRRKATQRHCFTYLWRTVSTWLLEVDNDSCEHLTATFIVDDGWSKCECDGKLKVCYDFSMAGIVC